MKIMSIANIFHKRPLTGRNVKPQVEINFSEVENQNLYKKLIPMENSIRYMVNHYNIKFDFNELPISRECFLLCEKDGKLVMSEDIRETDTDADIARKIYRTASKVL